MQGFFDGNVVFSTSIVPKTAFKFSNFNGFMIVQQALNKVEAAIIQNAWRKNNPAVGKRL